MPYVQARGVRPAPLPLPFWPVLPLPPVWHVPGRAPQTARQDRPHAWRVPELPGTPDLERPPVSLPLVPAAILRSAPADDPRGCRPTRGTSRAGSGEDRRTRAVTWSSRSEEHTSELQSLRHLVCRLLLEKK